MISARFRARLVAVSLAAGLAFAGVPAAAQTTGMVKGKVVDGKGAPVEKAIVAIDFKGGVTMKREVRTNKKGEFIQVGLQPGPYEVTASKENVGAATEQVQVSVGGSPEINFTLKPAAAGASKEDIAFRKLFDEGVAAANGDKHDEAIAKFSEAAGMQADCYACFMNLGSSHYEKKELEKAEAAFVKASELRPDEAKPVQVLADLYNAMGKREQAVAMATKAASLGAAGGAAASAPELFNQGVILWNAGKMAEAKAQFEAALKVDPNYADANYWVGMANLNTGNTDDALKYFENYLKIAPTGPMAEQAKGVVASLKKP